MLLYVICVTNIWKGFHEVPHYILHSNFHSLSVFVCCCYSQRNILTLPQDLLFPCSEGPKFWPPQNKRSTPNRRDVSPSQWYILSVLSGIRRFVVCIYMINSELYVTASWTLKREVTVSFKIIVVYLQEYTASHQRILVDFCYVTHQIVPTVTSHLQENSEETHSSSFTIVN
jgi:hypothetical protein